jgi:tetratricopeptide (TPR) repeat protein
MARTFAPAFSGIDIDGEGFVYAVSADPASENMIFRFNAKGENVIRSEGYVGLYGDRTLFFYNSNGISAFTGVSVTDFGVYAVVDRTYGRVFVYDFDGYVITIFSKLGDMKGDLRDPSAIAWNGYSLLVADRALGVVYEYIPTDFGMAALSANHKYYLGEWDAANSLFQEAVAQNATFYAAYSGIGRNLLMKRQYREAMSYFDLAFDSEGYSRALSGYRSEVITKYFPLIAAVILIFAGLIIYSEARYLKKNKEI